jgi:hypothetical protein
MTDTRIVTSTYRYKRPPRPETTPAPANDDRKPAIVTVKKRRRSRFGDVPDMAPEEHRRRGEAATERWREMLRRTIATP